MKTEVNTATTLQLYSKRETEKIEAYIECQYGKIEDVMHELIPSNIHCDIAMIPASNNCPYITLVTIGAGAYKMNIPPHLKKYKLERAEYVIFLPKDWNIKSDKEEDYWPIRMLKNLARLPIYTDSWLMPGHTVTMKEDSSPVASNTKFNSCALLDSINKNDEMVKGLKLGLFGDKVNFWQVLPLYEEELKFTIEHSLGGLLELMQEVPLIVDINRQSLCK